MTKYVQLHICERAAGVSPRNVPTAEFPCIPVIKLNLSDVLCMKQAYEEEVNKGIGTIRGSLS